MSFLIPEDDQISMAMMQGITDAFAAELRKQLQAEADIIIERTVEILSKRVKAKVESQEDFLRDRKNIHLTWCIKAVQS